MGVGGNIVERNHDKKSRQLKSYTLMSFWRERSTARESYCLLMYFLLFHVPLSAPFRAFLLVDPVGNIPSNRPTRRVKSIPPPLLKVPLFGTKSPTVACQLLEWLLKETQRFPSSSSKFLHFLKVIFLTFGNFEKAASAAFNFFRSWQHRTRHFMRLPTNNSVFINSLKKVLCLKKEA